MKAAARGSGAAAEHDVAALEDVVNDRLSISASRLPPAVPWQLDRAHPSRGFRARRPHGAAVQKSPLPVSGPVKPVSSTGKGNATTGTIRRGPIAVRLPRMPRVALVPRVSQSASGLQDSVVGYPYAFAPIQPYQSLSSSARLGQGILARAPNPEFFRLVHRGRWGIRLGTKSLFSMDVFGECLGCTESPADNPPEEKHSHLIKPKVD
jgi:hypothetical protein